VDEGKVFHGRFRVLHPLKKHNGVETLLGRDLQDDQLVVIKVASGEAISSSARLRLEHEAQVLRNVRSPWFAPLLHLGRDDGRLYMVLPYLPGISLEQRLTGGPLSVTDTLTVGRCLMTALGEAHRHGVLHRDLKPSNIIVDPGEPLSRATIIDFGLARSIHLDASIRDQPVGTARYMAPEQAGSLDLPVDERSDLYSAGVVFFECLAGKVPFTGENIGEVLRQHLTARPPELRGLGVRVPRALDEVIQRLLRKDPRDRYQSAEAVLADLAAIAEARERGVQDPDLVVGLSDRRPTLTEPAFVGRAEQLETLDSQLKQASAGRGGLVLVAAESGGGKTRLLAEFGQRGARQGFWVLRGQALDQVGQKPFQALSGVVAGLTQALADPGLAGRLRERLGDHLEAACSALPELAEVLGAQPTVALGPETFGQARSLEALAALLDALGKADRPALVLLDDCQWADELTLKLLAKIGGGRREPGGANSDPTTRHTPHATHLLLVAAYRSEEMTAAQVLRGGQALTLNLPPFGPEDVRLLAESMAGPLPEEALDVVRRFCEGSPFMAAAVLQGMVESGALVSGPSGWQVEPVALAGVQASRHSAAFLARRMELLPAEALNLLCAGAVLGKEFDLAFAAELAGQDLPTAEKTVDEARRRHIVWVDAGEGLCAFLHDKLRRTLLDRLPDGARKDLHLRAALRLEAHPAPPIDHFSLAYHFDAAGDSRKALPHALAAAEQARAQNSLEIAAQQYRIAERGAAREEEKTRYRIAEGLGDILMLQGRYDEAEVQFTQAGRLAHDLVVRARVQGKRGELAHKRGDLETAIHCLEEGLRLLGKRVPHWPITILLLCIWEIFIQVLHSYLPGLFLGRRKREGAQAELLAIRLYSRLTYAYWFVRGKTAVLWSGFRELNLAERYPPTPELAQAYSEHAPGSTLLSLFGRGIRCAEKSLVIRKALGDLWGQGQSLHFYGVVLYAAGRFEECIEKCREAVRLLRRTGDYWEVNIARYQIAASLYRLGDLRGALEEARGIHQAGLELGDAQASGISLDVWAWASQGKVPAEAIQAEQARPSKDAQRFAQISVAEGVRLLDEGRPGEAAAVLGQALRRLQEAGVRNAWVSPVFPWLATAVRRQLEALPDRTPWRRRKLLAWLRVLTRRGRRLARRFFPNELPHLLRESALLAAMEGRPGRARRFFQGSLAIADQQKARYERAQTLRARGHVGLELGWQGASADVAEAEKLQAALEAPVGGKGDSGAAAPAVTLSLADRFENVLDAGRRIATALTREAITAAVCDGGLRLLRGENCVVLELIQERDGEEVAISSSQLEGQYSRGLVRKALASRRAVSSLEGISDNTSESLLLCGARSSLCAPIFVRGRPVGCFYITHRQVAKLFGEDEERLADFIATLAGAALENAENFAELRRLNETLEERIAEQKRAEKRIQEQAALLDKAQDAISVVDLEDRILYWNRSAERLYGWSAAEALGRKATSLVGSRQSAVGSKQGTADCLLPTADWGGEALAAALEKGEWTGELHQVTRNGEKITVESRWTLVRDDEGRPRSLLVVNTNITEKKKIEARFLRAQRMESIGTLAGGIAHDLNNVLAPILMAVDLLKRPLPEAARTPLLGTIQTSAERGAEMVRQILSFARGVEGQRVMVQLKHLVRDLEKVLRSTLPKSIAVHAEQPRELWLVKGDATQLYQVLMNLCVNARDAMPDGGTLSITAAHKVLDEESAAALHLDAQPGPHVVLEVADTGTGMPTEVLERIFDPFFTTKEVGKGTGLGLATVLGIVKSHGGFVHVTSELGKGSRFAVYLPAAESTEPRKQDTQQAAPAKGRGELILVIDDEAPIRSVMTTALEANGYRVQAAREGKEGLQLYAQHWGQVRLVITDMMMPGLDGTATIRALREADPAVRILATSGLAGGSANGTRPNGTCGFLAKPFTAEELMTAVREALEGGPQNR
jgi:two-component system sensor kinase